MASYSSPNSLVQPPPPRGASSLRRRSPYARTIADTPRDAAIGHFFAAAVPEPRARRGRATGGAARRSAVAIAMAGEATGETKLAGRRRGLAQPGSRRVVVGGGGDATRFVFSRPKENTWTGARRGDDAHGRGAAEKTRRACFFRVFFFFPKVVDSRPSQRKKPSRARLASSASSASFQTRRNRRTYAAPTGESSDVSSPRKAPDTKKKRRAPSRRVGRRWTPTSFLKKTTRRPSLRAAATF